MKRISIAVGLLVVVLVLSSGALLLQNHATNRLIDTCNELVEMYQRGDIEMCRESARALSENLEKEMRWFPFFLGHNRMEIIFQQTDALPYLVNDDDPADFFAALASIRVQLRTLMDNEWPTPENIL